MQLPISIRQRSIGVDQGRFQDKLRVTNCIGCILCISRALSFFRDLSDGGTENIKILAFWPIPKKYREKSLVLLVNFGCWTVDFALYLSSCDTKGQYVNPTPSCWFLCLNGHCSFFLQVIYSRVYEPFAHRILVHSRSD